MQTTEQSCSLLYKWSTELETKYDPGFLKKKKKKRRRQKGSNIFQRKSIWKYLKTELLPEI